MVRPGVNVQSRTSAPARGLPASIGTWFVANPCAEGPANTPVLLRNLGDFTRIFGPRENTSPAYDCVDTYFREGGTRLYFSRTVGPTPVTGAKTLVDRAGSPLSTLSVTAIGPGAYGNTISIQVQNGVGSNTFNLLVWRGGVVVETSPDLASPADAVTWGTGSAYVRVTDLASVTVAPNNNPAVLAAAPLLLTGTDDRANIVDAQRTIALNAITPDLGPGQVSYPGATTAATHVILRAHARANNREAILDLPDSATAATVKAPVAGVNEEYGATFYPWVKVPGVVVGTTRTIPPCALVAGLMARAESLGHNPNEPAAGALGEANYATGVTQVYIDSDITALNLLGCNAIKPVNGAIRLYGYRTNADPVLNVAWIGLGNQRLRIAITSESLVMGEQYVFGQIDGQRHFFAAFAGDVGGILKKYYDKGALYGPTPSDAYGVDTGDAVNTPTTIANNELHVVIAARMSPFAEYVLFEIVKVGVADSL